MSALMKKVCCYCQAIIRPGAAYPVSHGVCDACAPRLMAEAKAIG
jgi:hypothetical protein